MNKKIKKAFFIIFPIALGFFLIWYSLSKLKPEDVIAIKSSFRTANYSWVFLSLFFGILSHMSRAYRWQFMLEPLGYKPKFANSVMTVLIAYLLNLVIPRSGEIARATAISKYENIPFDKAFGTIVAERIADIIMLLLIISVAFFLQTELIKGYLITENSNPTKKIGLIIIFLTLFIIGYKLLKKSKNPFVLKIKNFINGLKEGVTSILKMKKKWAFIFHTIFIWAMYVLMFYAVSFAIPETTNLAFEAIIVGFVVGALAMALTNGGLGTYPIFVASALILYHIPINPARAFGWIMWTAQTIMVLIFGGLSFFILPIYNKNKTL